MNYYKCPECNAVHSSSEWNRETEKAYGVDSGSYEIDKYKNGDSWMCPSCMKETCGEEIIKVNKINNKNNLNQKGDNNMKMGNMNFSNMFKGFNMRQLEEDEVGMGFDGKTYFKRKNGDYVRYDFTTQQIINTHEMKFNFGMAMIIPAPTVQVGDMIINGDDFVCITKISNNKISGVGLNTGRSKTIVKEVSAIGLNFYQKVVNFMDNQNGQSIFGNINPMMLMMMNNSDDNKNSGMSDIMQMMMMSQMFGGMNNQQFQNPFSNMTNMFGMSPQPINQQIPLNNESLEDDELTDDELDMEIQKLQAIKENRRRD